MKKIVFYLALLFVLVFSTGALAEVVVVNGTPYTLSWRIVGGDRGFLLATTSCSTSIDYVSVNLNAYDDSGYLRISDGNFAFNFSNVSYSVNVPPPTIIAYANSTHQWIIDGQTIIRDRFFVNILE